MVQQTKKLPDERQWHDNDSHPQLCVSEWMRSNPHSDTANPKWASDYGSRRPQKLLVFILKSDKKKASIGHKTGSMWVWERSRRRAGNKGSWDDRIMVSVILFSYLSPFSEGMKKVVGFVQDDRESPGRAWVPGAKRIQMSLRVQVEPTCTVVVFLVGNFSHFFNSLTPLFFPSFCYDNSWHTLCQ